MERLTRILGNLSYDEVMDIADEYDFYPTRELDKRDYDEEFTRFLIDGGFDGEILSRYGNEVALGLEEKPINLFSFQVRHKRLMVEGLDSHITFINASETGAGKTFKTLALAETDRRPLIVVCPKAMVLEWYLLAMKHNVEILVICNYETLIKGKMYRFSADSSLDRLPRVDNPYLRRVVVQKFGRRDRITFEWKNLPERTLLVFDEAHFCKNLTAQRTQLLMSAYDYAKHPENRWKRIGILLLSATIIEKRDNLRPFAYVLGLSDTPKGKSVIDAPSFSVREFGKKLMTERRMTRATMKEAREALNDTHSSDIRTKMFKLDEDDRQKIETLCNEIRSILLASKEKRPQNHLAIRSQKRQEIEALKIGIIFNELQTQRQAGYSVVVFVNFRKSMDALISMITQKMPGESYSVIVGGQTASVRLKEVEKFQQGETNLMISMIGAGGTGISLHDLIGDHPRYSLISPPESATQTIQALGRLNRIGSKSDSIQRIIFVRGTIEEKIAENLNHKIRTIGDLNNDDTTDNLFLFEMCHRYEGGADEESTPSEPEGVIEIVVDRTNNKFIVTVPDYMVDAFETGLPQQALISMRIHGKKYYFDLKHYHLIKEFLERLNV